MKHVLLKVGFGTMDIVSKAREMGSELTDDQVVTIAHKLEDNFDASIGINWDVVEDAIKEVIT